MRMVQKAMMVRKRRRELSQERVEGCVLPRKNSWTEIAASPIVAAK